MTTAALTASPDRPALRRYILMETIVGAVINTIMSAAITWLAFHGHARVPPGGLIIDAIPQSFMVALMSVLPVSLLTRARARRGRPLPPAPSGGWRGPKALALRAFVVAACAAVVGFLGFRLLTPVLAPTGLTLAHALVLKTLFGAILSVVIVPVAAIAALKDIA